ncbi:pyridoxal phosphate-dependent transferase [Aspergillus pseudodeflectus]|uniref:Pyridoxal phosphate-dependent transferase n=1 Tax=Aspergillus pseudodeflectus TaxID=176178 RepID=A0ABR4JI16_9EURO
MANDTSPSPVDFLHHLNRKSKARHPSPLKNIIRHMGVEGMISLAGATLDCLLPSATFSSESIDTPEDIRSLTLCRGSTPGELDLTQFLQYGSGAGNTHLLEKCRALTEKVHAPPGQYDCLLHPGNINAWAKVVGLLCEDNGFVIFEEYTYPSAQALWIPLGIRAVPVPADAEGTRASAFREMMEGWDGRVRGARRPRVEKRKDIYEICVELDIIIVEDDPYYFLQYPSYTSSKTTTRSPNQFTPLPTDPFLKTLIPSFLSLDTQSRVIRLESFSKALFPGLRLGYFIANPMFIERLLRATEVETQDPSGLSQAFVLALLTRWGIAGDWILDAFHKEFVVVPAEDSPVPGAQGLVACLRSETPDSQLRPVFSFVDPSAGMSVWCKFHFGDVTRFLELRDASTFTSPSRSASGAGKVTTSARGAEAGTAHFRFSFATPTKEQIFEGVERVARVVRRYWG